ncbi:alpha/beta hydrolase [Coraliomargarita sp. W4R53]
MIHLWPQAVPGQVEAKAPSLISENDSGNTTRLKQVTDPVLVVYQADPKLSNGAAVIICAGGGYGILAIDKEGYEVAEWLSSLGYTAFVLEYRVPNNRAGALQDAQRAVRYVRGMRAQWGIESDKIGIMGFSAGGHLSAVASTRYNEELYQPVDDLDQLSARPDFAILIYAAYLDRGANGSLSPELSLDANTPPMFLCVAANDGHASSSLVMATALRAQKIPVELHMLPTGGHGYGMRPGLRIAEAWPKLCEEWMAATVLK